MERDDEQVRWHRAYIAGVLHGDGYLTKRAIGLQVKDKEFAQQFAASLRLVFGVPSRVGANGSYWRVFHANNERFVGAKDFVSRTSLEMGAWLRGFFDSEGNAQLVERPSMGPGCYQRRVSMYSTEINTLQEAQRLLKALRIESIIGQMKLTPGHIGTKDVYELRVQKQEGFLRFRALVGSSIYRKQTTLSEICESYQVDHAESMRRAQKKGVETRTRRRNENVVPFVLTQMRARIDTKGHVTWRECQSIKGYSSLFGRHYKHSELVQMAKELPNQ